MSCEAKGKSPFGDIASPNRIGEVEECMDMEIVITGMFGLLKINTGWL